MITLDDIEIRYLNWRNAEKATTIPISIVTEIAIIGARELRLIRMNLDRVNENLDWLCKIQDTQG